MDLSVSTVRSVEASDSSEGPGLERMTTHTACEADTWSSSETVRKLPRLRRKIVVVLGRMWPRRRPRAISVSTSCRSASHMITTVPPPVSAMATLSSPMTNGALSVHPRTRWWPRSTTSHVPCSSAASFRLTFSTMNPNSMPTKMSPTHVTTAATARGAVPVTSACVPGSRAKV